MFLMGVSGRGPGGVDTTVPSLIITTTASSPVNGTTGVTNITATITASKTVTGLVVGDISTVNCSLSSFTAVTGSVYTVVVTPSSNGTFSINVPANSCVDSRGVNNTASNTLSLTFSDISGFTYDLQNAATIAKSQHFRGHVATFSDCTDLSTTNYYGGEYFLSKYNLGATANANGTNQWQIDAFNFGRVDFGRYTNSTNNVAVDEFNKTNRNGVYAICGSYQSGVTSYAATLKPTAFYFRNSNYETFNQTLPKTYATGITDDQMINRGPIFRWDYYSKSTSVDYLAGTLAQGDTNLTSYISQVLAADSGLGGWYTNFVHWHRWHSDYPDHYYALLNTLIGSNDVFRGNNNIAAEYYFVRESVTSVSGTGSTITVNYGKPYPSSPYSRIITPLWIKVDLTGTGYAGHDIVTDNPAAHKIRSMGSNVYYISTSLDYTLTTQSFHLYVTSTPTYINLTVPGASRSGNVITIDQPCKKTLYRRPKPTTLTTSTDSFAIPTTDNTTVNITVGTGLSIAANKEVRVFKDSTHYFFASVISYNSGTGALSLSSSANVGTGTFSTWTIQNYTHYRLVSLVERDLNLSTTHTIAATLDLTNYEYQEAFINAEGISNVIEF